MTDSFPYLFMPSDKRNLIMSIAEGLIFSLLNVALSGNVPFHQLQQLQCLYPELPFVVLCTPFHSPLLCR